MIDPDKITDFERTTPQLEEFLLFCIAVAGHNAHVTAITLDKFLESSNITPFEYIKDIIDMSRFSNTNLTEVLKTFKFGCYTKLGRAFQEVAESGLDLKTCSVNDLENIYGFGPKTARYFILHSRPNQNDIAVLDTHVLKHLKSLGIDVGNSTPTKSKYKKLEKILVDMAKAAHIDMATLDLQIWLASRVKPETINGESK